MKIDMIMISGLHYTTLVERLMHLVVAIVHYNERYKFIWCSADGIKLPLSPSCMSLTEQRASKENASHIA